MPETPTLTVTWQGTVRTFKLDSERAVRLGRHPASEVSFDPQRDLIVSSSHAKVVRVCGDWTLVDLESRNGVWVSGSDGRRRISKLALAGGEEFELGRGGPIVRFERPPGEMRKTAKVEAIPAVAPPSAHRVPLQDRAVTVGRESPVEIHIPDPRVSRRHATITPVVGGGHRIVDHDSRNGTFVNGERITSRALAPGDRIIIGGRRIEYQPLALAVTETDLGMGIEARGLTRKVDGKAVLDDVWFTAGPGDLVAVMGPSRCGKTTLLDALVGLRAAERGSVSVGGTNLHECPEAVRGWVGHVAAEDALYDDLTVASSLAWAAWLRLPGDHTVKERHERVERVLADMELTNHRDRAVARLTAAQRQRVALGLELITEPAVLCLDEPTRGLDPSEAYHLVRLLRELAAKGRTVIAAVRSVADLDLFDRVAFLVNGKLTFFGRPGEALTHFDVERHEDLFHACRERGASEWRDRYRVSVPCRRFLPEYHVDRTEPSLIEPGAGPISHGTVDGLHPPRLIPRTRSEEDRPPAPGGLFGGDWNSIGRSLRLLAPPLKRLHGREPVGGIKEVLRQLSVLGRRDMERLADGRDDLLWLAAATPLAMGLVIWVAAPRSDFALLWLGLSVWWLAAQRAAPELVRDRAAFRRDRRLNLRVFSYLVARFLPLSLTSAVQGLVLLATVVHLCSLDLPLVPAGILIALAGCAGSAAGLAMSAAARTPNHAHALVSLVLLLHVLFSGAFESDVAPPPRGLVATLDRLSAGYWTFDELKRMAVARGAADRRVEEARILELEKKQNELSLKLEEIASGWSTATMGLAAGPISAVGAAAAQLEERRRALHGASARLTDLAREFQTALDARVQATGSMRDAERRRIAALAPNHLGSRGAAFGWLCGLVVAGLGLAALLLRWRELADEPSTTILGQRAADGVDVV